MTAQASSTVSAPGEQARRLYRRLAELAYGRGPMMGTWTPPIQVKSRGAVEGIVRGRTLASYASDNYLRTLGISLLRGRDFTEAGGSGRRTRCGDQ